MFTCLLENVCFWWQASRQAGHTSVFWSKSAHDRLTSISGRVHLLTNFGVTFLFAVLSQRFSSFPMFLFFFPNVSFLPNVSVLLSQCFCSSFPTFLFFFSNVSVLFQRFCSFPTFLFFVSKDSVLFQRFCSFPAFLFFFSNDSVLSYCSCFSQRSSSSVLAFLFFFPSVPLLS